MSEANEPKEVKIFPQYKEFFTDPLRYNISYGGRAKGSTWNIARGILMLSLSGKYRILCTREYQNSINESVYRTLVTQIEMLGLSDSFTIRNTSITSVTGSEFIFKGLRNNIDSIKSMEGINICWVAEADRIPKDSWEKLIPTIRAEDSVFYIDFNTDSEEDYVYEHFVKAPRDDTRVMFQTYKDNPQLPEVLRKEMEWDKANDYDKYMWVWEGNPRAISNACIFLGRFRVDDFETPEEAQFFHGVDWGFSNDPTVAIRCFVEDNTLYIDREVGAVGVEVEDLPELFSEIDTLATWKSKADSARPELISYMQRHGYPKMEAAKKGKDSITNGIDLIKSFKEVVIHPTCTNTLQEFKLYSWVTNRLTGEITPVPEDKNNHCFVGPTMVHTQSGKKAIVDLVGTTGFVYSYDNGPCLAQYTDVRKTRENAVIVEIEMEDGSTTRCTADHLMLTTAGWVEAQDLTSDSNIIDIGDYSYVQKYIHYNGLKFTRDERTGYYLNSTNRIRLHRYVYECEVGPIPKGHSIHHIDHDKNNNSISNLTPMTKSEHNVYHMSLLTEEERQAMRDNLTNVARPKASEWHGSEEGRAWHRIHAQEVADNMKKVCYACAHCNKVFWKKPFGTNIYCTNACRAAARRASGVDDITLHCKECGKSFVINKYKKKDCCSRSCTVAYRRKHHEG